MLTLSRRIVELQTPGMPVEFLLSMLRRQAASSISGLAPSSSKYSKTGWTKSSSQK
ncbi:hypothetical protein PJ267_09175 [Arthrobacter sp. OVS8]|nr:hypothetical protein PJ267_09175 [Arthrobacter sp. OVS8]